MKWWIWIYFHGLIVLRKIAISHPICENSKMYDDDIIALQSFYNASNNTEYWYPEKWDYNSLCHNISYVPPGIYLNQNNGRIFGISLQANNITGTIPSQLSLLSHLTYINLGSNRLYS